MLVGYTPDEAPSPTYTPSLVGLLSPDEDAEGIIGIRELALETLKRLTGRDDLGYDPDQPAGKGFDAWNDLLRKNELRPPASPRNSSELRPPPRSDPEGQDPTLRNAPGPPGTGNGPRSSRAGSTITRNGRGCRGVRVCERIGSKTSNPGFKNPGRFGPGTGHLC